MAIGPHRVAVTGIGIISCIGNDARQVTESLREMRSGIEFKPDYAEVGLRSQVAGTIKDYDALVAGVDRKLARFMSDASIYTYLSMEQAVQDSGLPPELVSNDRTGLISGSGGASPRNQIESIDALRERGVRRVGPFRVPRTMSSTVSANLATAFKIKGLSYSLVSACATSTHSIGAAAEQIAWGRQDVMFAGGGEEDCWELATLFDAMGALSSKYNDTPATASRPYDKTRDGFVTAAGGVTLVLENLEHAKARGAKIYGEIEGYGATSDGADMVVPSGEGAERCMNLAMSTAEGPVDYINTHGTSTPAGDIVELEAIKRVFGSDLPDFSSSKCLTGHSLGAVGGQEAIYCLLMMQEGFIQGSANITELDPAAEGLPLVRETKQKELNRVLSNSFGFGGTNATLVFKKV